jgi:RNA-directed DNA polymerase
MIKFLNLRITDKRVLRLIKGWLSAGVVDGDKKHKSFVGTPQGGAISPLLAKIYLHYALDLWVDQWRKRHARGEIHIVRYADHFVIELQYQSDGFRIKEAIQARLATFKLRLNESKAYLLEFGCFAKQNRQQRKQSKPETFDFWGGHTYFFLT